MNIYNLLLEKVSKINFRKALSGIIKWFAISVVGVFIAFIFFEPLQRLIRGPGEYLIYVVGDYTDSTAIKVKAQLKNNLSNNLKIGQTPVRLCPVERSDNGDPEKAAEIAQELTKENNVLFVVGHFFSTTTKNALPIYMASNPQIPVLLTTETNPFLEPATSGSKCNCSEYYDEYKPVYCLSPNDINQSKKAAELAKNIADKKGKRRFWIIQDVENQVYSNFLAKNFKAEIQKQGNKVLLHTDNTFMPSNSTFSQLNINSIFFAGDWTNALIAVEQIDLMIKTTEKPLIILSDGCVDKRLIEHGNKVLKDIYLTHPLSVKEFNEDGFGIYGKKAANEINDIIETAASYIKINPIKKWLGLNRINDARIAVKKAMRAKYEGEYRVKTDYHIWQIQKDESNKIGGYKFVEGD